MAITADTLTLRSRAGGDYRGKSRYRTVGLAIGLVGVALATVVLINGIVAGNLADDPAKAATVGRAGAWAFGLTPVAFATVKVAIAAILAGILVRLWIRVDSVKAALPALKPASEAAPINEGAIDTPYGKATVSASKPKALFIHRMARTMWAPMLAMGAMAVLAGFVLSLVQTGKVTSDPSLATQLFAWVQGLQFLGEGFLLSGISFLLGTILYSLRTGGAEVQESVGVAVKTLRMPNTAKAFIGLMMLGLMAEIFQFIVYVVVASFHNATTVASYFAWLGPVREAGLGLLLSGIVLALATIARALGFQFWRLGEIVTTGR